MSLVFICAICLTLLCSVSSFKFGQTSKPFTRHFCVGITDADTPATKLHQVFIGNLPFDINEETITSLIHEKAGSNYQALRLAKEQQTGRFRGFGYLDYIEKEQAEAAVAALAGIDVDGRQLKIDLAKPRIENLREERTPSENSCFIGNLDFGVTEEMVLDLCNNKLGTGVVSRVRLAIDRETGRRRGFGHIDFPTPEEAKRAIEVLTNSELMGRGLRIDHARRKDDAPARVPGMQRTYNKSVGKEHSVFIGNLAWEVSEELVRDMLDDVVGAGSYHSVRLAVDRVTGRPKGYAHVDFVDASAAEQAIKKLNDLEVMGRLLRADVAQRKAIVGGGEEVVERY